MIQREELWNAINRYVAACGGDTSNETISNERMKAVVAVESAVDDLCAASVRKLFDEPLNSGDGTYRP